MIEFLDGEAWPIDSVLHAYVSAAFLGLKIAFDLLIAFIRTLRSDQSSHAQWHALPTDEGPSAAFG